MGGTEMGLGFDASTSSDGVTGRCIRFCAALSSTACAPTLEIVAKASLATESEKLRDETPGANSKTTCCAPNSTQKAYSLKFLKTQMRQSDVPPAHPRASSSPLLGTRWMPASPLRAQSPCLTPSPSPGWALQNQVRP
eukprot:CAMPEP_0177170250 /NCGR_PEP_ID=MMETSP0367-20130122/9994_1 /TAXON_ID=447022 ORGANISM="Scrippsiella hangoei-like, Strain SHHI-4" /NCGR_SAMPLE_ID=MMETSP0367 /ASSEMBLY_ACC=CAM_ASM_000362 /LENGTH=137 /DNA_ID=CAMNT_0018616427 /DNA_START=238 /DNA_END=652 /DNA_ORIENTATION=+